MTRKNRKDEKQTVNMETYQNYIKFLELPLKFVGCWDWYSNPSNEIQVIANNVYFFFVLFTLSNMSITLIVNLYTEWVNIMGSLHELADGWPLVVSVAVVIHFTAYKKDLKDLLDYMNLNFKFHSARGLTNMSMVESCGFAKRFAYVYTACTMFSVSTYVIVPMVVYWWTNQPLQYWMYMDVTRSPFIEIVFLQHCLGQAFVGLAIGQLSVFFACNSILLCGQLDLLCCSVRNSRYTALLQRGAHHAALARAHRHIVDDETYNYMYNKTVLEDSVHHYDKVGKRFTNTTMTFDIYSPEYDAATTEALRECAKLCQVVARYKEKFEAFVSPLLALRVIQVTLYLCTLLYAASLKFELTTVEYLAAVALDIFVYCYYGNQIIIQAERVSTAAYQSAWPTMGVRPRKLLLNILLANKRTFNVRAGRFLPMNLSTFVAIIKTSFSYYTLLVNVNNDNTN